jgi:hypothetical protein
VGERKHKKKKVDTTYADMLIVSTSWSSSKSLVADSSSRLDVERRPPKLWQLENASFRVAARNLHLLGEFGGGSS